MEGWASSRRAVAAQMIASILAYCVTETIAAILVQAFLGTFSPIL